MSYLKNFEYVLAIAEHGGISGASDALNIAQPALSRYLKKLESELGVELFDRSRLPLTPTEAGKRYIAAGKQVISIERQLEKELAEIKDEKNSLIKVGISPSRSPYIMPAIIEAYRKKKPSARVCIVEKTTAELSERLFSGEIDLVINVLDESAKDFDSIELFEESILVAVKSSFTGDTAKEILLSSPLISVGKNQAMGQIAGQIAKALGREAPQIECQSIESALALVKRGLGAMIIPDYIARFGTEDYKSNLRFFPLENANLPELPIPYERKICIFYRKGQFLTQAERDFIECVKNTTSNFKKG